MPLNGKYKDKPTLSAGTQALINAGQSLVLVRESGTSTRTSGTMWYKGQVIGFTVEDAERTSKIDDQTCIATGKYNITLDGTGKDALQKYCVDIPGKGKVFARVGTDASGVSIDGPGNLDFGGVRIHGGKSEGWSAGCIIFSDTKFSDGTLTTSVEANHNLTWLIHNSGINKLDVVNEFQGGANYANASGAPGINTLGATNGSGSVDGASIGTSPAFVSPFEPIVPQKASQKSTEVVLDGETYDIFVYQLSVANPQDQLKDTIFDVGQQVYLPLRDIVKLLNKYILIKDTKNRVPIVEISLTEGDHMENPKAPLLCLGNPLQLSVNPAVCVIKNEAWLNPDSLGIKFSYDPATLKGIITNLKQSYWYGSNYQSQPLAVIQNIYVNLGYVFSLVTSKEMESQDKKEKNDIYVFDFLRTMMSGINAAIGNIANFDIFIDPQDGKARIIDVNYVDAKNRERVWADAYELQMHNLKSTVRNYSFESQIFNDQAAIVAIGAQTNGGALGQNVNSLVDFNQNLRDRIVPSRQAPPPTNPGSNEQQLREQLKNLKESIAILLSYVIQLDIGDLGLGFDNFDVKNSSKYSNALKDIISFLTNILKSDAKNRAIIPTKLSIEIDGIGGIGIGNIFKIPLELLPRGYKGDGAGPTKIGYTVTGLSHNVDGNDWKTKVESQFIILDPPRGLDINLASIQADVINITLTEEPIQITSLISSIRNLQNAVASAASAAPGGGPGGSITGPTTRPPEYGNLVDVSTLTISAALVEMNKANEGFYGKVYTDQYSQKSPNFYQTSFDSHSTIGYGTLIDTAEEKTKFTPYLKNGPSTLSETEATDIMVKELKEWSEWVRKKIKNKVSQNMFDALASYAYNAGGGKTVPAINLLNQGKYREAGNAISGGAATSGGKPMSGLSDRRKQEAELFLLGYTGTT